MKHFKTCVLFVLTGCLSAFVVVRIVHFPENSDLLYQAIPDATLFFSEHADLADRWKVILENPAIFSIAETFGAGPNVLSDLVRNEATQMVLDRFAADRVVVAYTPELRPGGQAAWVLASWVGVEGQFLRWGVYDSLLKGFEKVRFGNSRSGWVISDVNVFGERQTLSMAVSEGVLLVCLSRDGEGVQQLVRRLERSRTLATAVRAMQKKGFEQETTPDRGWVRFFPTDSPAGSPSGWHFGLRFDEQNRIAGRLRGPLLAPDTRTPSSALINLFSSEYDDHVSSSVVALNSVLGAAPGILAVMPFAYGNASLQLVDAHVKPVLDVFSEYLADDSLVLVSLTTPDYGGTVLEIPVPALMLGFQIEDSAQGEKLMDALLDSLNAEFGWGLIRPESARASHGVVSIDSVTQESLRKTLHGISPSYCVMDDWLLISTSESGLQSLTTRFALSGQVDVRMRWFEELRQVQGNVVGWADLATTSTATRKLIGAYDLWLIWQGKSRTGALRQNLALFDRFMLHVQEMRSLCLWSDLDESSCEFKFLLGGKQSG